jgi:hypothetical protein
MHFNICHPRAEEAAETAVEDLQPFSLFSMASHSLGLHLMDVNSHWAYYNKLKYSFDSNFAEKIIHYPL